MRLLAFLIALSASAVATVAAHAERNTFLVERGQWTIANGPSACRALNRPPADFNYAPYNGLQIVTRADNSIGVEVFFWPGALTEGHDYRLKLDFTPGIAVTLDAHPTIGDYMLSAGDDALTLWALFQKTSTLVASVEGEPRLNLSFALDDISRVLTDLQNCERVLPKT